MLESLSNLSGLEWYWLGVLISGLLFMAYTAYTIIKFDRKDLQVSPPASFSQRYAGIILLVTVCGILLGLLWPLVWMYIIVGRVSRALDLHDSK